MDEQGQEKSAQAYQVIGTLLYMLDDGGSVSDDEQIRALDYFSDDGKFDEDFLPWPTQPTET